MNLSQTQINWIKEKGRAFYVSFKMRLVPLLILVGLSLIHAKWIASKHQLFITIYAGVFSVALVGIVPFVKNLVAVPTIQLLRVIYYDRQYPKREYNSPKVDALIEKMDLKGKAQVYITKNPVITGPCCNVLTGKIFLPEKWIHPEQEPLATISHELGHIKAIKEFNIEIILGVIIVFEFTLLVTMRTIPLISKIAVFTFEMLLISYLARRNEYRADEIGAKYNGPEGLISLFEKMIHDNSFDDDSETHPSLRSRIKRLEKII